MTLEVEANATEKEVISKIYIKKYTKFCSRDFFKRKEPTPEAIAKCVSRLIDATAKIDFDSSKD